jgi:hypothetical protein
MIYRALVQQIAMRAKHIAHCRRIWFVCGGGLVLHTFDLGNRSPNGMGQQQFLNHPPPPTRQPDAYARQLIEVWFTLLFAEHVFCKSITQRNISLLESMHPMMP